MDYTHTFHNSTNKLKAKLGDLVFILFRFVISKICLIKYGSVYDIAIKQTNVYKPLYAFVAFIRLYRTR
jgi:hypothetical protein